MSFQLVNPEDGFTSSIIKDPRRFVGRAEVVSRALDALMTPESLIAVHGKRGVGKSSLLRQIQQMATGNYSLAQKAGLAHLIPKNPRTYYSVYYACDSMIADARDLIVRMCNDSSQEDGLLRLVPDQGKELVEFSRSDEASGGFDVKLLKWGIKGVEHSKYASAVPSDPIQTFRNFLDAKLFR